jgi:hypothetical protein
MEPHEITHDPRTNDDKAAGARTLTVLAVVVVALAIACVALMILERTPRRAPPTLAPAASSAALESRSKPQ